MQRVQIDFPETTLFTYQFTIVEEDINIANHVGNERILVLANHSREKMFEHLNLKLYDLNELHGIVVANHTINYKSEGFLNDIINEYIKIFKGEYQLWIEQPTIEEFAPTISKCYPYQLAIYLQGKPSGPYVTYVDPPTSSGFDPHKTLFIEIRFSEQPYEKHQGQ